MDCEEKNCFGAIVKPVSGKDREYVAVLEKYEVLPTARRAGLDDWFDVVGSATKEYGAFGNDGYVEELIGGQESVLWRAIAVK